MSQIVNSQQGLVTSDRAPLAFQSHFAGKSRPLAGLDPSPPQSHPRPFFAAREQRAAGPLWLYGAENINRLIVQGNVLRPFLLGV